MRRGKSVPPPDDLAAFCADHWDRVLGALTLFTGDRPLAEELAQEAFVRTCQHWEKVRDLQAPAAWVHRVGINLAISRARRRRNESRALARLGRTVPPAMAEPDPRIEDEDLARALASLAPEERACVVLRFHADLSVADTAGALGVAEGTVKTRTRRALARLREAGVANSGGSSERLVSTDGVGPDPAATAREEADR